MEKEGYPVYASPTMVGIPHPVHTSLYHPGRCTLPYIACVPLLMVYIEVPVMPVMTLLTGMLKRQG